MIPEPPETKNYTLASLIHLLRKCTPAFLRPRVRFEARLRELTEGGTVVAGPFRGLKLRQESYYSPIYNKLLGSYELELAEVLEAAIRMDPQVIVDIGAAEGYYACGFALRCQAAASVIAYEADYRFRYVLKRNIEANRLEFSVKVKGECRLRDLKEDLDHFQGQALIICDAEGFEHELIDVPNSPGLQRAAILVELHEYAAAGIAGYLKGRCEATHHIVEIHSRPRTVSDVPALESRGRVPWVPRRTFNYFFQERPAPQSWLWMIPKARPAFAALPVPGA